MYFETRLRYRVRLFGSCRSRFGIESVEFDYLFVYVANVQSSIICLSVSWNQANVQSSIVWVLQKPMLYRIRRVRLFVCLYGQRTEFACLSPKSSIICLSMWPTHRVRLFVCLCPETRQTCRVRLFGSCRKKPMLYRIRRVRTEFDYLFVYVLKTGQRAEFDCLGHAEAGFVSNPKSSIICLPVPWNQVNIQSSIIWVLKNPICVESEEFDYLLACVANIRCSIIWVPKSSTICLPMSWNQANE
jgi:hypothetical protein